MKKTTTLLVLSSALYSLSASMGITQVIANVTKEPSSKSELMGVLMINEDIEVLEKIFVGKTPWYKTPRGYVLASAIKIKKDFDAQKHFRKSTLVDVYESPSKASKSLKKIDFKYLESNDILEEKNISGDMYIWRKVDGGWINVPYIKMAPKKEKTLQVVAAEEKPQKELAPKPKEVEIIQAPSIQEEIQSDASMPKSTPKKIKYFVGVGLNYNQLGIEHENQVGDIPLNKELQNNVASATLQLGTKIDSYVVRANYEIANFDDIMINSLYASLDYEFDYAIKPFIGVSLGMSYLEWKNDPINAAKTTDTQLSSFLYGAQMGFDYEFYKNWSFFSEVSYQKLDFKTNLISLPAKATIKHKDKKSLGIGLRYSF